MANNDLHLLINRPQAARLLNVSVETVEKIIQTGALDEVRLHPTAPGLRRLPAGWLFDLDGSAAGQAVRRGRVREAAEGESAGSAAHGWLRRFSNEALPPVDPLAGEVGEGLARQALPATHARAGPRPNDVPSFGAAKSSRRRAQAATQLGAMS